MSQLNTNNEALKKSEEELDRRLTELDQSQKIEKQNSWISQGLNELGQLTRENEGADDLYDLILSKLVKYVGVNQGSLFVLEDEEREVLVLTGCYAYDRKKFVSKKIEVGQGLVG